MSEFNIEVQGGSSVRLPTAGKYCEKDIIVTASGGGGEDEQYTSLKESVANLNFSRTPSKTIILDCSKFKNLTSLRQTFNTCINTITVYLSNTEKITDWYGCFFSSNNLVNIYGDLSLESATNLTSAFQAPKITNISFVENSINRSVAFTSTLLTANSTQSIFGGLSPTATGQTLTLPKTLSNADAEAVVTANIEEVDGVTRIKGKEGWSLVR